ncbi:zinc finger, CCHC-type containing protein [Tanacetum coccineum]|uniref:Zinc finger, CCHC-type containing protein n=1 Tax=Tanacetum coccineum TaxID=301880 RepID=A0ABQ5HFI2_9ASTR
MSDALFDVYQNVGSTKELWDQLMAEDASSKKFLVSNFNNYKMVDSRSVMEQYHELLQILAQFTQHGLNMDESISVSSIIDKLPPLWKDFKHTLKHNKDELSLDNAFAWWIDSGATWHACKDRCWFETFYPVQDGSVLYMGDESTKPILGRGNVVLEFSSGKSITLVNVVAVVRLSEPKRNFLGEKGIDCIFIGYVEHFKAYIFYVIETNEYISVNSVIESRDAMFDEKRFTSIPRPKSLMPSSSEDHIGESPIETPTTHWSNRARKEAINDEMDSIMKNNTWILSDLPPGCKLLGCKWIFKRKMKVDGTIDKFKARLVIQGFRQKERIDYFDTYAPVARISTIRLLIALVATYNLVIHQIDVKTTFLNGDLEEEVMKKPKGFIMSENEHKFDKFGNGVIICLYADDMLIFGTDQDQMYKMKKFLSSNFSMKDMGEADVILGIRIKREDKGITITQSHYIKKILKKFKCDDCCPVSTPLDPTIKLMPNTGMEYSRAIGCLMYAMTSTRPDIACVMGKLSMYTSNPSTYHWHAIMQQTYITDSTMEAEFVALAAAGKEAEWLRNMIYEIPLWPIPISSISIHCDSATTLAKAYCQYTMESLDTWVLDIVWFVSSLQME